MPAQGTTPDPAVQFANDVAAGTGFDPRVIFAQEQAEGAPGNYPYYYNYLNIPTTTATSLGFSVKGTGPGGIAYFGDYKEGVAATIAEFKSPAIALTREKGKSPAQQIADIANSPWASSHYGNPPGTNLTKDFVNLYGQAALGQPSTTPLPPSTKVADPFSGAIGGQDPLTALKNSVSGITGALDTIDKAFAFIFSYRFLEILGGGLLLLLGLYLLGKQLGVSVPKVGPVGKAAAAVGA